MKNLEMFNKKEIIVFNEDNYKIVSNFKPYMYVPDKDGEFVSLFGDRLKKLIFNTPKELKNFRDGHEFRNLYEKHFEGDIRYLQRYLIDEISIPLEREHFDKCYIDIETNYSVDIENTPEPIIAICCYSNKYNDYFSWVWRKDLEERKQNKLFSFSKEEDMLNDFFDFIKWLNPDVFLGWNLPYDIGYIVNRSKLLELSKLSQMSKFGNVYVTKYGNPVVSGRVLFDLLEVWRKISPNKLESNALKEVAKKILKDYKIEVDLKNIWEDTSKLIEYNKKDVKLCLDIDNQENLFEFYDERRREVGCTWEALFYTSGMHDVSFLREAKKKNIVLPSIVASDRGEIEGSIQIKADAGIYENILCFDFERLYPSIILQFNMSPETVNKKGIILPNGVSFNQDNKGFICPVIERYFLMRNYYQEEMNKYHPESDEYKMNYLKQYNYKIFINSVFGYLGFERSRLFNKDIFRSILYMGRFFISSIKNFLEAKEYKVVFGHTDSLYILGKNKDINELIKEGKELEKEIKIKCDEILKKEFNLENKWIKMKFEKINSKMFFGAKETTYVKGKLMNIGSRYAFRCKWNKGKICDYMDIVGFETIRSDSAKITQKTQSRIFEMILMENAIKEDVYKYVDGVKEKLMSNEVDFDYIGIPKTLNRNVDDYLTKSAHVRSSEWSKENLGIHFRKGDKFKMIYGHIDGLPQTRYFAFKSKDDLDGKKVIINWEKMMSLLIDGKVNRIYTALGWIFPKMKNEKKKRDLVDNKQKTLEGF